MSTVNLQFVFGVGDETFGQYVIQLRNEAMAKFKDRIYCPRILDWTEGVTLNRLLGKWNDPTILAAHSCGNSTITNAAVNNSMEKIPYLCCMAPSIWCSPALLTVNVARATQFTSWWGDGFNPGGRQLLNKASSNNRTALDVVYTGQGHVQTPGSPLVRVRLFQEIERAIS